jgi:hypothetical protein
MGGEDGEENDRGVVIPVRAGGVLARRKKGGQREKGEKEERRTIARTKRR